MESYNFKDHPVIPRLVPKKNLDGLLKKFGSVQDIKNYLCDLDPDPCGLKCKKLYK